MSIKKTECGQKMPLFEEDAKHWLLNVEAWRCPTVHYLVRTRDSQVHPSRPKENRILEAFAGVGDHRHRQQLECHRFQTEIYDASDTVPGDAFEKTKWHSGHPQS